jgi:chromosome segregation ATPase
MTDVNEIQAAVKRGDLILEEVKREVDETIKNVKVGLDNLKSPIEDLIEFEKKQNDEISKFETKNLSLSKEITNLKGEKENNERTLKETKEEYANKTEQRSKLETKKRELQNELVTTTNQLEITSAELSNEQQKLQSITEEVRSLTETSEKRINELEKEVAQKRDALQRAQGEQKALEYLVKNKHIEFNEIKVIDALTGRANTDLGTITKVTGLSRGVIEKTLKGLMKRDVLTYDDTTGEINVTGSLKL